MAHAAQTASATLRFDRATNCLWGFLLNAGAIFF
jgi:hypothetical protein